MKTIEIIGDNYLNNYKHIRYASRAIIIKNSMILLSYASKEDLWMIPGGGMENDETAMMTAIREVKEETGHVIKSSEAFLEIDEYYDDFKYVTYYVFGDVVGLEKPSLTPVEQDEKLESRWLPIKKANEIFANYQNYAKEKFHSGIYLREVKALTYALELL